MKIQIWLKTASTQLATAGIKSAQLDSALILQKVLQKPREWVILHDTEELGIKQLDVLNKLLLQRKTHVAG